MFSRRTDWPFEQNPLMLALAQLKEKKIKVFDLTTSNPTQAGLAYPDRQILKALSLASNILYQPHPFGQEQARQAIAQMYERQKVMIRPEQIILTSSSSEAYAFLFRLLLNPDEEALFPSPSYPLFDFLAQLNDVDIQPYPLCYQQQWEIDLSVLKEKFSLKTRALVLVNPNNPTGGFVKTKELAVINHLCRERDVAIICDEVFSDYVLDMHKDGVRTLSRNTDALTFVLGGLSKSLGLPQMKLSWIIVNGPEDKVARALERLEIIADTYLSVNTPAQNALPTWLRFKDKIQRPIQARIQKNQKLLQGLCAKTPFKVLSAEGGWYAIIQLPEGLSEERFVEQLLREHHVFAHPGYFFDLIQGAHLVVSLLTPEDVLREGLSRIVECSAYS